jgi:hypothetical protein
MNDKGEIKEFSSEVEAVKAGFTIKLSPDEAQQVLAAPENERLVELAWIRFWANQRKVRKPWEERGMRHAFITGIKAARHLAGEKK